MSSLSQAFLEYVIENFHDLLSDSVEEYISENIDDIPWGGRDLEPDTAELFEIEGKRIIVANTPGTVISFDVVVEAEVNLSEVTHHHNDSDDCTQWFRITCSGDLEKGLEDFETGSVCVYRSDDNATDYLGDTLTPYLNGRQLDEAATGLLKRYYPEALKDPTLIDADILATRMGLTIEEKWLSLDGSVYGAMFFSACDVDCLDEKSRKRQRCHFNAGTVVVDPRPRIGTLNYTKVHECSHWELHRKWFLFQHLINRDICKIECSTRVDASMQDKRSETEWLEWQANSLAARILMPFKQFQMKTVSLIKNYISDLSPNYEAEVLDFVIYDLAEFFGVSRTAATIRMVDTGFKEALGVGNFVDGRYVPTHAFKRDSIERNQTYSISFKDLGFAYYTHPDIKSNMQKGSLVFVESHICLNTPKFIEKDPEGNLSMTEYARFHMDECCILFDVNAKASGRNGKLIYDCALCRGVSSNVIFEATVTSKGANPVLDKADAIKGFNQEMQEVITGMPMVFGQRLGYLMKWAGMTQEQLAEKSGMSARAIREMSNDPRHVMKLESIIALCIGLKLPFILSQLLIQSAGLTFSNANPNHIAYMTLLLGYGKRTIEECNEFLIEQGVAPLNDATN